MECLRKYITTCGGDKSLLGHWRAVIQDRTEGETAGRLAERKRAAEASSSNAAWNAGTELEKGNVSKRLRTAAAHCCSSAPRE